MGNNHILYLNITKFIFVIVCKYALECFAPPELILNGKIGPHQAKNCLQGGGGGVPKTQAQTSLRIRAV